MAMDNMGEMFSKIIPLFARAVERDENIHVTVRLGDEEAVEFEMSPSDSAHFLGGTQMAALALKTGSPIVIGPPEPLDESPDTELGGEPMTREEIDALAGEEG